MRAVLYLRLSSSDEASTSIARQEADLRDLAEREGWEIVRVLVDDGVSGRKTRANATEALRLLREREADVLMVHKLDRWSRQGLGAMGTLADTLDAVPGSLFVAYMDGLRSDQVAWRLIAAVLSEVARTEAENTSARVRSTVAHLRDVGRFAGGTVPFGYRTAPREDGGRTLVPDPAEAEVVRRYAERILAGESQSSILMSLANEGVPTTRSAYRLAILRGEDPDGLSKGVWSFSGVSSVWTGESLLGRVSRSRIVPSRDGGQERVWEVVRDADGAPLQAYEPILDLSTVMRLRAALRDPKRPDSRRGPRRERAARLLSGVIHCGVCGAKLWVTTGGRQVVYSCGLKAGVCPGLRMKADNVERAVEERFLQVAGEWPEVEVVEDATAPELAQALADVEAAIADALAELATDGSDGAAILRRVEALKERRATIQDTPVTTSRRVVETGRTVSQAWSESSIAERRAMLGVALDHVLLAPTETKGHTGYHPERLTFVWNS